jgi:LytS/YehU family sensor histidine kinase
LPSLIARMAAVSVALALPLGALSLLSPASSLQNPDALDRYTATGTVTGGDPGLTFAVQAGNWAFVLLTWQTLYFGSLTLRARRWALLHRSELTRALQLAELRALKSQLNPHFLFNALNTVRALIAEDPKRAQEAVTRLASTLRYTLSAAKAECVPLERELQTVEDYLTIEALRFEDRLRVERRVEPETLSRPIPVMLLVTLVENAIKHGVAARPGPAVVRILASARDGILRIEVENPTGTASHSDSGVGLQNARERLRLLFGEKAAVDLDLSVAGRAVARVVIPQTAPAGAVSA